MYPFYTVVPKHTIENLKHLLLCVEAAKREQVQDVPVSQAARHAYDILTKGTTEFDIEVPEPKIRTIMGEFKKEANRHERWVEEGITEGNEEVRKLYLALIPLMERMCFYPPEEPIGLLNDWLQNARQHHYPLQLESLPS